MTSTPLSIMRRCFCADIPPTIAAMLTCGGGFLVEELGSEIISSLDDSMDVTIVLRWDETCKANSRVGARTRALRERFFDDEGRGWESR